MKGGRKLEFDKHQALESAMYTFWRKGYVGTSLSDLTENMGINKPSLYSTFGNKEELFIKATDFYLENNAKPFIEYLHTPEQPLSVRLNRYISAICSIQFDSAKPKGCFISCCVSEGAGKTIPPNALAAITSAREFHEQYLTEFFDKERDNGCLKVDLSSESLALFVVTLIHGTAAMARAGKSLEDVRPIILLAVNSIC